MAQISLDCNHQKNSNRWRDFFKLLKPNWVLDFLFCTILHNKDSQLVVCTQEPSSLGILNMKKYQYFLNLNTSMVFGKYLEYSALIELRTTKTRGLNDQNKRIKWGSGNWKLCAASPIPQLAPLLNWAAKRKPAQWSCQFPVLYQIQSWLLFVAWVKRGTGPWPGRAKLSAPAAPLVPPISSWVHCLHKEANPAERTLSKASRALPSLLSAGDGSFAGSVGQSSYWFILA